MLAQDILDELWGIVGGRWLLTGREDLSTYAYDASFKSYQPDAVILPGNRKGFFRQLV